MASVKNVDDADFKPGVMSPNSKLKFADWNSGSKENLSRKNLVLDESTFEESFLLCMICREKYDADEKSPRLLPCHHSFCFPCIMEFFRKERAYHQSLFPGVPHAVTLECPTCKSNFISTEEGMKQMPIDHRIVQLMDFVKHTDRQTINYCSKHTSLALNFFCEPCVQPVCRDCTVVDHKEPGDHFVLDIHDALLKYTPVLDNAISEMEKEIASLDEKRSTVEKEVASAQKNHDELVKSIHETFDRLREALKEREEELIEMSESQSGHEKEKFEELFKTIIEKRQSVVDNISALKKAKEDGKVEEMFKTHQRMREYRAAPPIKLKEIEEGTTSTYSFNCKDEKTLVSRINTFGDISSTAIDRGYSRSSYSSDVNGSSSSPSSSSSTGYRYIGTSFSSRYIPRTYRY